MIGEKIRDFEIQSELGSGGYGVVYRAHDESVDRDVAIKVILPQYANQPEFVENFAAEARLVAALEHPRIVPLYSYWHDEQGAFLVMRYVRGGSLRGMLAKQGALPLNKVLRLVEQIAEALNAAHEAGVVHRDLKPDNILIDERGNAYLTDFGIAKQLSDENASATDAIKGTFAYLSPEQIQQTQVSPQTDIYALGVMLFEMLAGQHPFHETPVGMMVMKHLQEPLPDVRDLRDDLDYAISDIIHKATAKDAAERYTSTLELVDDLKAAISGVAIATPQPITPVKKKPTTNEERNRYAMLENVRKFWVEGVLENSLHDAAMIDLGLKSESGAVDNPWDTLIRTPSGEEAITDESIVSVFDRLNGKLLILGDPGSGKTTTLLTLARDLLFRAELDEHHPIPVVFNLSSWSENQPPLTEWVVEELNSKYQVPRKVGTQWVDNDELLLLLDGLDEVSENVRDACVQAINAYRSEHGFVDVVVCSRIKDYEALAGQLRLNGAIVIQPLNEEQVVQYLDGLGADVTVVRDLIIRDAQLRELAQSPLMLSIMVLAYRGESADDIPDFGDVESQRNNLFKVYVERMFERRIGEKPFSQERTHHYLRWLASRMRHTNHMVFNIEDLRPNWLNTEKMRNIYTVAARGNWMISYAIVMTPVAIAQSLLAPFNIMVLLPTYLLIGTLMGWLFSAPQHIATRFLWYLLPAVILASSMLLSWRGPTDIVTLFVIAITGLIFGFGGYFGGIAFAHLGNGIENFFIPEQISASFQSIKLTSIIPATLVALSTILFNAIIYAPKFTLTQLIVGALIATPPTLLFFTLIATVGSSSLDIRDKPNAGIERALRNGLKFGSLVGTLMIWFMLGFVSVDVQIALVFALSFGIQFFILGFMLYGGAVVFQHYLMRLLLQEANYIPHDLVQFLDYAASLILLRKVGGGYIFIHRYLLEYFADLERDNSLGS